MGPRQGKIRRESICDDVFMNSKKARVTVEVEAGRAGFRSRSTLHAGVRHLDFTLSEMEATEQF